MIPNASPAPPRRRPSRATRWLPVVVLLVATACSGGDGDNGKGGADGSNGAQGGGKGTKTGPPPQKFTLNPAAGAAGVAPASPVTVKVDRGTLATVLVKSADGDVVSGTVAGDRRSWASKGKLGFGATYTVQVTTTENPTPQTAGTFTTAPVPGAARSIRASSVIGDGKTYGVAMPVILKLSSPVRGAEQRAAYEKMLTVRSTPATRGAWGWVNSRELHFRPRTYWAAGSRVHVSVDTAGRSLGAGLWSRTDLTLDFTIGTRREIKVSSRTKYMTVIENGRVMRSIPVSLGRPKYPSSSGTMVVIDKRPEAMFDSSTYGLAVNSPDGYRTKVQYPMRLTWGGEFIHSAPWSVADQGVRNVSHGCINVGPANAVWLYQRTQVGDPVTVEATETRVKPGDGWTAWSVDFGTWLEQSAAGERSTAAGAAD